METVKAVDYRWALEALRNGVPNREAVKVLGSSQNDIERRFLEKLRSVHSAAEEAKQVPGLLIAGGFGTGKSHLLDYLEHLATLENFVCSRVVISKETPLFDPAKVFLAAINGAVVPGLRGQAIHEIALKLRPDSRKYAEFFHWANTAASVLSPLFPATLLLHERLNNDPELVDEVTGFWSGEPLPVSRIRQGLKQIGCSGMFSIKPVKIKELFLQRFVFISRLLLAAGYKGWVLLIDEIELIGRYSLFQRGRSYAELARWMGKAEGQSYPGILVVAAITDDFDLAVLQQKGDRDSVGARLREKRVDEYTMMAGRAEAGIRLIERDAVSLLPPDESTLAQTYLRLKQIHGEAYGWNPPEIPQLPHSLARRMRSYVRRWVNEWDLKRLYPGAEISAEEEQDIRPTYDQDDDLEELSELLHGREQT